MELNVIIEKMKKSENFFDTHALRDNCPVVARSFTGFLKYLLEYKGDYFYWMENGDFEGYGDAYQ